MDDKKTKELKELKEKELFKLFEETMNAAGDNKFCQDLLTHQLEELKKKNKTRFLEVIDKLVMATKLDALKIDDFYKNLCEGIKTYEYSLETYAKLEEKLTAFKMQKEKPKA